MNARRVGQWIPVIHRGDGAWIGIMPGGKIGVGVEMEARDTLEHSRFVPMWPFMEQDFTESLEKFANAWPSLGRGGVATPEKLFEMTVRSAWASGRPYWMRLSAAWAADMAQTRNFDTMFLSEFLAKMSRSSIITPELRDQLLSALASTRKKPLTS
jgi:hypothetical protein